MQYAPINTYELAKGLRDDHNSFGNEVKNMVDPTISFYGEMNGRGGGTGMSGGGRRNINDELCDIGDEMSGPGYGRGGGRGEGRIR